MAGTSEMFYPDVMANWPWKRQIHPNFEEVAEQSASWLRGFKAFSPRSQLAFDKCDFGLLTALSYPWASKEHLRTACDLMNLYFLIDEYTDVEDASVAREMVDIVKDAVRNPHKPRPDGEILLGEAARQFWELAIKTASPTSQRHFIESFHAYLDSVVDQAADRDSRTIRTIETYFKNRRQNIGTRPAYAIIELGLELGDEVVYHPSIKELAQCATDLVILDNDLASYNKEQATGDDRHNSLTIVMHQFNTDLNGAINWVARYHKEVQKKFLDGIDRVPSFGPVVDEQIKEYIHGIANWPRSNECWNFEGGRYFGKKGSEIQKSRIIPLLPKVPNGPTLKREQVVIPFVDEMTAAPLGPDLIHNLISRFKGFQVGVEVMVLQAYGLTETSGASHFLDDSHWETKIGSIGHLVPNSRARIILDDGETDARDGEPGELWLQGPTIMKNLNNSRATNESMTSDGWFKTGDVAVVDLDGCFKIIDRKKELIKYKGFQVPPAELESVLLTHPMVIDAGVIGVYSESHATEYPRAYVVPRGGVQALSTAHEVESFEKGVQAWIQSKVAQHKYLRGGVVVIDAIPKSAAGKILRRQLRDFAKKEVVLSKAVHPKL